jgi:hypothetical protein
MRKTLWLVPERSIDTSRTLLEHHKRKTMNTVIQEVVDVAKKIAKRETQRFPEAASPGDCIRQGDVYVMLLDELPSDSVEQSKWDTQLAPGTTHGSRHILDSKRGVSCYALPEATEFDGPVLLLKEERVLTHPEHGDWILSPGIYAISYQRTQDALDRQRRVQD